MQWTILTIWRFYVTIYMEHGSQCDQPILAASLKHLIPVRPVQTSSSGAFRSLRRPNKAFRYFKASGWQGGIAFFIRNVVANQPILFRIR